MWLFIYLLLFVLLFRPTMQDTCYGRGLFQHFLLLCLLWCRQWHHWVEPSLVVGGWYSELSSWWGVRWLILYLNTVMGQIYNGVGLTNTCNEKKVNIDLRLHHRCRYLHAYSWSVVRGATARHHSQTIFNLWYYSGSNVGKWCNGIMCHCLNTHTSHLIQAQVRKCT